jgi:hypothetical protein
MSKIITILSSRRVWAAIGGAISLILSLSGSHIGFDPNTFTNAIMSLVNDISALAAIILPLWSLISPKTPSNIISIDPSTTSSPQ